MKRKKNGQFAKGSKPIAGFQKGSTASKSPRWKGGRPKCPICNKILNYGSSYCRLHSFTVERKEAIRRGREGIEGSKHPNWKGDEAGYRAIHRWIQKRFGKPTQCEKCGKVGNRIHWSNFNHKYRRVRCDWSALCAKCHRHYDISAKKV